MIVIYKILWKWWKVGNKETQYGIYRIRKKKEKKTKMFKSQEYSNSHEPLSQK